MFSPLKNRIVFSTTSIAAFSTAKSLICGGAERITAAAAQQPKVKFCTGNARGGLSAESEQQNHKNNEKVGEEDDNFPLNFRSATNFPNQILPNSYQQQSAARAILNPKNNSNKNPSMDEQYFLTKFDEYERTDSWDYVFQRINVESESQAKRLNLGFDLANSFHEKNRYRNVLPYDQNRISLKNVADTTGSDAYINASPLHLPFARRNYILTQGPLPNTAGDFWQMVYEQNVSICIMLSKVMEKSFIKCHSYFPCKEAARLKFDHFECELEHEERKPNYVIRRLRLTPLDSFRQQAKLNTSTDGPANKQQEQSPEKPTGPRIIHHFQFTTWPDFGVPEHTDHFLEFLEEVRNAREKLLTEQQPGAGHDSPVVCHCSAGIGRTGTFVIVDSVVSMIEKKRQTQKEQGDQKMANNNNEADKKVEEQLDSLEALVIYIRRHRMGLIQTAQQLRFCWKTIVDWIKKGTPSDEGTRKKSPIPAPPSAAALSTPTNSSKPASPSAKQTENPGAAILTDIRWISSPEPPKLTAGSKSPQQLGDDVAQQSAGSGSNSTTGGGVIRTRKRSNNEREDIGITAATQEENTNNGTSTSPANNTTARPLSMEQLKRREMVEQMRRNLRESERRRKTPTLLERIVDHQNLLLISGFCGAVLSICFYYWLKQQQKLG